MHLCGLDQFGFLQLLNGMIGVLTSVLSSSTLFQLLLTPTPTTHSYTIHIFSIATPLHFLMFSFISMVLTSMVAEHHPYFLDYFLQMA